MASVANQSLALDIFLMTLPHTDTNSKVFEKKIYTHVSSGPFLFQNIKKNNKN